MIDINRIKNETLQKLTWEEIGNLGLLNEGVMTYRGTLKSRVKGWKREVVSEYQTNFVDETETLRVELIKIQQNSEMVYYAMRLYDIDEKRYHSQFNPMAGLRFLK